MFRCNLPPPLLAEWPGSFTCHCGSTGMEQTHNKSHKVHSGEVHFPVVPARIRTRNLSIKSLVLLPTSYPGSQLIRTDYLSKILDQLISIFVATLNNSCTITGLLQCSIFSLCHPLHFTYNTSMCFLVNIFCKETCIHKQINFDLHDGKDTNSMSAKLKPWGTTRKESSLCSIDFFLFF